MRSILSVLSLMISAALFSQVACSGLDGGDGKDGGWQTQPAVQLVDPFIGTGGKYFHFGSTVVGASMPFSLAKPGPDTTGENGAAVFHHYSGYHFDDEIIEGFSQVHISGTGSVDYGALLIMPTVEFGSDKITEKGYRSYFRKDTEDASVGYYKVTLEDPNVTAEVTASTRCSMYRFSYDKSRPSPALIVDLSHALVACEVLDAHFDVSPKKDGLTGWIHYSGEMTGRSGGFKLFFDLRLEHAATGWTAWSGAQLEEGKLSDSGPDIGLAFELDDVSKPLLVKIGLSYVDLKGASANLDAEIPGWDFDQVHQKAVDEWASELGRVDIEGGTTDERVMFYTALYHSMLHPTIESDVDGRYTGFDHEIHHADGWTYYTDFSMWDTYRCTHSLYTLLFPNRHGDMLRSLLAMSEQGGSLPKWPIGTGYGGSMLGTPADVILAEAFLKGVVGPDWDEAYRAVVSDATEPQPHAGRYGVEKYLELGYVPEDEVNHSAARTLEFGVADAAIARWAKVIGKTADAEAFLARSKGYKKLWDPESQFFRGKNSDGTWVEGDGPFNPLDWNAEYYVEGTAWQYLWLVPQDVAGLVDLFANRDDAADKLEEFFATPEPDDPLKEFLPNIYYWQGNEPDIHAAYLFDEMGRPHRTQYWVRNILGKEYAAQPAGLPGNDDLGTMSAWFVWSAAGLYPNAGQTYYWIASPLFRRVTFHLSPGVDLDIEAPGASHENLYVQSLDFNGRNVDGFILEHEDIIHGGTLEFQMGDSPSD